MNKDIHISLADMAEGDMDAFGEIYGMLSVRIFNYARAITKNKEMSEDITHDVFIQILKQAARLAKIADPIAYIMVTARNQTYNYLKRLKHATVPINEIPETNTSLPFDKLLIEDAFSRLPANQRETVYLYHVCGFTQREVSKIMGVPLEQHMYSEIIGGGYDAYTSVSIEDAEALLGGAIKTLPGAAVLLVIDSTDDIFNGVTLSGHQYKTIAQIIYPGIVSGHLSMIIEKIEPENLPYYYYQAMIYNIDGIDVYKFSNWDVYPNHSWVWADDGLIYNYNPDTINETEYEVVSFIRDIIAS